jgi:hypothetical protein
MIARTQTSRNPRDILQALVIVLSFVCGDAFGIQHMVEMITPRGAGRGERVQILVHGVYLEDPQELVFQRPGIRCVALESVAGETAETSLAHGSRMGKGVRATLEIALDCPLGEHTIRVRSRRFLSEHATFWVGPFRTVEERESRRGENDAPRSAQEVAMGSTVNGRILPGDDADVDCYAVDLRKGQRLGVELEAVRLGTLNFGGENDCQIRVLSPAGKVLVRCDDTALWLQDPFASLEVPEAGRYVVEVSQQMHTPGEHCHYRLHLGDFRRPSTVYPAGGRPGELITATLFEEGGAADGIRSDIRMPQVALTSEIGVFDAFPEGVGALPSGLPMRVTNQPNILEDPEQTRGGGQRFDLPAALNGVLTRDGEVDRWRFRAVRGERWIFRVYARALGTPVDARIVVRKGHGEGAVILDADDATLAARGYWSCHTRLKPKALLDPAEVFEAPEDGDYLLEVSDTRGMGSRDGIYRIEIERQVDGLHPYVLGQFAFKVVRNVSFVVPQENRWSLPVLLGESLGTRFKGDLEVEAVGLPEGVTMDGGKVVQGLRNTQVTFHASRAARPGTYPIRLRARALDGRRIDGNGQQGVTLSDRRGGFAWHSVWLEEFMLAVVDPAPFRIEPSLSGCSLSRNGEVTVGLKIQRASGFDGPLELQADWLPPGVEKGPPVVVGVGQTQAEIRLRASDKAMLGEWSFAITGSTTEGSILDGAGCRLVTTPRISLLVGEPYLKANIQRTAIERRKRGVMEVEFDENRALPGPSQVELKRLPHGVHQVGPAVQLLPGQRSCRFELEVSADALVGQYKEILVEVAIREGAQVVRQQIGNGILRVDPEKR